MEEGGEGRRKVSPFCLGNSIRTAYALKERKLSPEWWLLSRATGLGRRESNLYKITTAQDAAGKGKTTMAMKFYAFALISLEKPLLLLLFILTFTEEGEKSLSFWRLE